MTTYTHFSTIARDAHTGTIERLSGKRVLGKHGIKGVAGATCEYRVVSIEGGAVMGWGDASAIGRVEMLVDGTPEGDPVLALLS